MKLDALNSPPTRRCFDVLLNDEGHAGGWGKREEMGCIWLLAAMLDHVDGRVGLPVRDHIAST